jgi:drug/metabolite transporter (DMT)-like permease
MNLRASTAFIALCVVWGIPYFFIKLALDGFSPAWVAWGRIAVGASLLVPIAARRGVLKPALAHKGAILAFALVELVGPFLLISLGERWITSSLAGILIAAVPMAVIVLSPLFGLRERLGGGRIAGLLIGFAGVVVLLGLDPVSGLWQWAGVGCLVISMLGYALGGLVVQRYLGDVDELGAVTASLVVGCVLLLPIALATIPQAWPPVHAWLAIGVLGAVCTALGLLLAFYLIGEAGAARATLVTYVNPAVAALLGVFVLDEPFGLGSIAGLVLILTGSWFAAAGPKSAPGHAARSGAVPEESPGSSAPVRDSTA